MASKTRLAQAYYDLAVMLDAGVPILRSLDILIQGRKGSLKRVLSQVRESLSQGSSLAESMGRHRRVFPDLDRMLVEAAETSGSLGDSFKMLSQWHEFMHRIIWRIRMGLVYPFFLLHFAALVYGFPDLILGRIGLRGYVAGVFSVLLWLYIPLIVVLLARSYRDRLGLLRLPLDYLILQIPILGAAIYHLSVCRYARAFGMLYKAGVPMSETTERAALATGNMAVAQLFAGGAVSVRKGGMAWEGFSRRLRAEYRDLWQIGEESGELDNTVDKVAEIAADRADRLFTQFSFWLPRIIYFIIMGVVAMMILRLGSQIYSGATLEF